MFIDLQQKKKFRNIFYSKITIVFMFVILIYVFYSNIKIYKKYLDSSKNLNKAELYAYELENKINSLDKKINDLNTESGLEREIRSKFAVVKQDEKVVTIVPNDEDTQPGIKEISFWNKIKNFLGF